MSEVILHQYDSSPFSEKVRICLGIKGLAWRAAPQPVIMPKPDLVPLTGGYRRIPVMQIGADVYCDSQLIVRELDRRFPERPLFPRGNAGFAAAIEQWCDKGVFQTAVVAIFGSIGDSIDLAFIKDREALSGQPFNLAAMKAMAPYALDQLRTHAALLTEQLDDGRAYLAGDEPCLADAAGYYNFWFLRTFCPGVADRFDDLPGFDDWYARVAAIGHGNRSDIAASEALDIARGAQPAPLGVLPGDSAQLGQQVALAATDYGRDPVAGSFAGSSHFSVTVARDVDELGRINVHVPRLGYSVTPL
ncbi:MAG: glutathione S-transferase family protein [Novosphingobium sp.]